MINLCFVFESTDIDFLASSGSQSSGGNNATKDDDTIASAVDEFAELVCFSSLSIFRNNNVHDVLATDCVAVDRAVASITSQLHPDIEGMPLFYAKKMSIC